MLHGLVSMCRLVSKRLTAGAAGSVILVLLAAGAAVASIPDSAGVIHGCYNTVTGALRIIDSASSTCRPNETALLWNVTGPQGPPGPQGPAGSAGSPVYFQEVGFCGSGGNPTPNSFVGNNFGFAIGTFTSPVSADGCFGATFRQHTTFEVQNVGGPGGPFAVGTGTITCDPCTIAGKTGAVSIDLTVVGEAQTDDAGNPTGATLLGGTWTITGATGQLDGLSGGGTYTTNTVITGSSEVAGSCCFVSQWTSAQVFSGLYSLPG